MITFKRFLPSSDSRAGLKDDITFAASELSPFEPNSTTVPAFDEGLTSFHSLTDIEATKEIQNQGSILYVNVDPNAPIAKTTIDNLNLIPATQQQVIDEIQRVAELRKEVRNNLSSFVSINIDEKQILTSSTQFSRFSAIDLFLSKKGDILDVATELSSYQGLLPTTFTNFVIGTTQKYAQVIEIVDKNKVKVDKIAGFVVNGYFTMANPKYFAQGAIRSDFLAAHNSYPPRDVQFFKIAAIDSNTKIITLVETYLSPDLGSDFVPTLFSTPEIQSVNEDKDLIVAYAGAPILYSYHHLPAALPLLDAQTFIEGEIPATKIYLPKSKKNPDATYIGNLKRESLDVLMYDDDTEVFLVKAGEAQPSVSVSYKLLTEKDSTNYGDVEVKIKLESYPAKVQTEGVANVGATAIRLSAKMAIVPVRLLDSSLEKTKLNNGTVNKRTNQPNISKSDKRTDGEFYFSYQTRLPTGQIVNLNKYGTIRVKDRINIYDPSGNILSNNVIKTVDIENSLIILEKPLGVTLASRSIIEIPQTPFNPGRKYSISISATDKLGVASGYQQFKFTTKSLPQTKGTDGAHWEKIPLASFPPSLDLSIPDSFANAVAFSVANLTDSWSDLNDTLLATTANLQDLSCSVGSLIDGLKGAQNFATSFAQKNNNTQIYVRQVGLDPLGVINSQQSFMNQVNQILNDTGTSVGQIPRLTPAEVPLDPIAIANALGSGGTVVDNAFGGITTLGGSSGKALDALGISASIGLDFKKLSNDSSFRNGFGTSSIEYKVLTIIKKSTTNAEVSVETKVTLPLGSFTITNSKTDHNNGTFSTKNANDITTVSSLGKNITTLKYKNSLATTEFNSTAKLTVSGSQKIKAAEVVRVALEQEGLYGTKVSKKTISISELLDILIKHNIVGVNPETLEDDRSIATERLVRIAGNNPQRIGGILFVGKAPNLPALARKAKVLSNTMVWLKPLTDTISASLVASAANASGISYDPSNLDLTKLESQSNIANQDAYAAREKLEKTGVLNYQMPTLNINKDNPTDTNFTAWRHYSPVQLLPSLQAFGSLVDSKVSNFLGEGTLKASNGLSKGTSFLTGLIEGGQSGLQSGMNKLEGFSNVINSVTDDMNQLNKDITDGINFLKNLAGTGPISMEGHLIGAKLTLQSNQEYVESVKGSINDTTDPNRPTFGNSPTPSTLDAQNRIRSATTGTPSSNNTALWFGIVLVVIGKDKQDLGEQLHVLTDLLAMDGSAIALPAKPKLTFSGLKI